MLGSLYTSSALLIGNDVETPEVSPALIKTVAPLSSVSVRSLCGALLTVAVSVAVPEPSLTVIAPRDTVAVEGVGLSAAAVVVAGVPGCPVACCGAGGWAGNPSPGVTGV